MIGNLWDVPIPRALMLALAASYVRGGDGADPEAKFAVELHVPNFLNSWQKKYNLHNIDANF